MSRLNGQVALVTGGGAGIGRGIAIELAREGARVAVLDIDETAADGAASAVNAAGGEAMAFTCDVTRRHEIHRAVEAVDSAWDGVDILVNNAVWFHYAPLVEVTDEVMDHMIDVGLKGAIRMSQACTPRMQRRGGGCIINLSSPAAELGLTNAGLYSAVKGGIAAITRQQAAELGASGIRVNAIAPGPVETDGTRRVIDEAGWQARRERTPLGRLATVEEVGRAAVYLASDDAATVSGATLKLDGAFTVTGP